MNLRDHQILALTIDRPWANLIADGRKTVETRMWAPHLEHLGRYIAIHASTRWNQEAAEYIGRHHDRFLVDPPRHQDCPAGILAVARLVGWVERRDVDDPACRPTVVKMLEGHAFGDPDWRWFTQNRYAWVLRDVRRIAPVAAVGRQKLWIMSKPIYGAVRRRYGKAVAA